MFGVNGRGGYILPELLLNLWTTNVLGKVIGERTNN